MLLPIGIFTAVLGYTTLVWGVGMADGNPATFAYLLGLTATNTAKGATSSSAGKGTSSGVFGDIINVLSFGSPSRIIGIP